MTDAEHVYGVADLALMRLWPNLLNEIAAGRSIADVAEAMGTPVGNLLVWASLDQSRIAGFALAYQARADLFDADANAVLYGSKVPTRAQKAEAKARLRHAKDMRKLARSIAIKLRVGRKRYPHRAPQADALLSLFRETGVQPGDDDLAARAIGEHQAAERRSRLKTALYKLESAYAAGASAGRDMYDRLRSENPDLADDLRMAFPEIDQRRTFRQLMGFKTLGRLPKVKEPMTEDALFAKTMGLLD